MIVNNCSYKIDHGNDLAVQRFADLDEVERDRIRRAFPLEDEVSFAFDSIADVLLEYYQERRDDIDLWDLLLVGGSVADLQQFINRATRLAQDFRDASLGAKIILEWAAPGSAPRMAEVMSHLQGCLDSIELQGGLKRKRGAPRKKGGLHTALGDSLLRIWLLCSFEANEFSSTNRRSAKVFFETLLGVIDITCTVRLIALGYTGAAPTETKIVGEIVLSSREDSRHIVRAVQDAVARRRQAVLETK